jgi:dCMP deaminase
MVNQSDIDQYYMDVAIRTAKLSRAQRKQVGAIVIKDDRMIGYGFNGTPPGWKTNACEEFKLVHNKLIAGGAFSTLVTRKEVIHAEANAIAKVAKSPESSAGSTMYCTHSPCMECAKQMVSAGIERVVYYEKYGDGVSFLREAGIRIEQIDTY